MARGHPPLVPPSKGGTVRSSIAGHFVKRRYLKQSDLQPVSYTPSTKIILKDSALGRISLALVYAGDLTHC